MPKRSAMYMRRFEALEPAAPGGLGAVDPGSLALFGLAIMRRLPLATANTSNLILMWAAPDIRPGKPGSVPGEISRIDISRQAIVNSQTTSSVTFYSGPIDFGGSRVGVRVRMESFGHNPHNAAVDLIHAAEYTTGPQLSGVGSVPLNETTLAAIDAGHPERIPAPYVSAILPVLEECSMVLGGVASTLRPNAGVRLPIW